MAAFRYGHNKMKLSSFTLNDISVISKALKVLEQPLKNNEGIVGEIELSPKDRKTLSEIKTVKEKLKIYRKILR